MVTKTELTEHNVELYLTLCRLLQKQFLKFQSTVLVWKCKETKQTFLLGIGTGKGTQIIYELPISKWDEIKCKEFTKIPKHDGHTPQDILDRLKKL